VAIVFVARLDGRQPSAKRALQIEKPPPSEPAARRIDCCSFDFLPNTIWEMRFRAIAVVHRRSASEQADGEPAADTAAAHIGTARGTAHCGY
jgi:hypothetical protein